MHRASQHWADTLFPPVCLACEAPLGSDPSPTLLCTICRGRFVPIDPRAACSTCLRPLPQSSSNAALSGLPVVGARCGACLAEPPALESLAAVWLYQPPLSAAILALKFRRLDFLAAALAEIACGREPLVLTGSFDAVVPVPLAPLRRLSRGFDQAERIARVVAGRIRIPMIEALSRPGLSSARQSRLGRSARRKAARQRYRVRAGCPVAGCRLLLVDDVVTTGATLSAAAEALLAAGAASVAGFALAATPSPVWGEPAP